MRVATYRVEKVNVMRLSYCAIIVVFFILNNSLQANSQAVEKESKVVASVDEYVMDVDEFHRLFEKLASERKGKNPLELKKEVINQRILDVLLVKEAERRGLDKKKDVQERLDEIRKELLIKELIEDEINQQVKGEAEDVGTLVEEDESLEKKDTGSQSELKNKRNERIKGLVQRLKGNAIIRKNLDLVLTSEEQVENLSPLLNSPRSELRAGAVIKLGEIGGSAAFKALLDSLKDDDYHVRWNAIVALSEIGNINVLPALKDALEKEAVPELRELIGEKINAMERKDKDN